MNTITINTYKFDELSDDARRRAIKDQREARMQHDVFPCQDEYLDTLNAFCKLFDVSYDTHYDNRPYVTSCYDLDGTMQGLRLRTYLLNNYYDTLYGFKVLDYARRRYSKIQRVESDCPLTGFGTDNAILQPIREFIANPRYNYELRDILNFCFASFHTQWEEDQDWYLSDECIASDIEDNDYDFYENGGLF